MVKKSAAKPKANAKSGGKFYVTTAIDYVNAEPHIGHAYQKIVADILARWNRLWGKDVFFLTGTDEHGQKIERKAKELGKNPKEFCDEMSKKFADAWKVINIEPDRFIRTTDPDHQAFVKDFVRKVWDSGDIYKGKYEGYYCIDCETFYPLKDLNEGMICPVHKRKAEFLAEETYFFKLSKYQKQLLKLYKDNPEFILPDSRRNEITNRVKEGLKDLSITRTTFSWGIPFPYDTKHVIYVWFDALINYLSGAGKDQKYWPADIHLLGKDNGWFHAVIWPAMLISAGYKLPKTVFIHGFLTVNGEKISKSLGNTISPVYLSEKYGTDAVRYFIVRQIPFGNGEDGDFAETALKERYNGELANKLGNLVSRVGGMIEKAGGEVKKAKTDEELSERLDVSSIQDSMDKLQLDRALNEIMAFVDACNEYVQQKQPWKLEGDERNMVLYSLVDSLRIVSILLYPFIPGSAEKINAKYGFEEPRLDNCEFGLTGNTKVKKSEILFKRLE